MTPEQLAEILLAIVGVVLSLVFKFWKPAKDWYDNLPNQGLAMLAFVLVTGGAYFGLSCTPFAAQLGIKIACDVDSAFVLLKAIFIIASANQLTYLYVGKSQRAKG